MSFHIHMILFVRVQARERAALKETLHAEREAATAELEALRLIVQRLESQKHERPPPCSDLSEKKEEKRRRAEDKAAQEILQLTQVGQRVTESISNNSGDFTEVKVQIDKNVLKLFYIRIRVS